MSMNIELTEQEVCVVIDALNEYFHNANTQLENGGVHYDGGFRGNGIVEKKLLEIKKEMSLPLIYKLEQL